MDIFRVIIYTIVRVITAQLTRDAMRKVRHK